MLYGVKRFLGLEWFWDFGVVLFLDCSKCLENDKIVKSFLIDPLSGERFSLLVGVTFFRCFDGFEFSDV